MNHEGYCIPMIPWYYYISTLNNPWFPLCEETNTCEILWFPSVQLRLIPVERSNLVEALFDVGDLCPWKSDQDAFCCMYLMMFIPKVGSCQVLANILRLEKKQKTRGHIWKTDMRWPGIFQATKTSLWGCSSLHWKLQGIGGDWSLGHSVSHFVFEIKVVGNNRYL